MAEYRLSAQVIGRSSGRSAVAAAAYRSGGRLTDERTGQLHDYGRKQGVLHSEIMTPDNAPAWMADRSKLWNAVEKAENRKNSQLAREVQLSLPHELTAAQRVELVRGFVASQFVGRGMIADVAIHAPDRSGDQRNHHAHVLLTMRELTAEGFGKKARDWNDNAQLDKWREEWARQQNRALERYGHAARVDHRSFAAQGIDREPTQHLGPIASAMERNGKPSRIGDENRAVSNDNTRRTEAEIRSAELSAQIAREQWKLGQWAHRKRAELDAAHRLSELDLSQKHARIESHLEQELKERNAPAKRAIVHELAAIDTRQKATGFRRVLHRMLGRDRIDRENGDRFRMNLAEIRKRENEERGALRKILEAEREQEERRQEKNRERLEKGIRKARENRERAGWINPPGTSSTRSKSVPFPRDELAQSTQPKPPPMRQNAPAATFAPKGEVRAVKPLNPSWLRDQEQENAPDLATKKRTPPTWLNRAEDKPATPSARPSWLRSTEGEARSSSPEQTPDRGDTPEPER